MGSPFTKPEIVTTPSGYLSNEENSAHFTSSTEDTINGKIITTDVTSPNLISTEYLNPADDYPDYNKKSYVGMEGFVPFLKVIQTNLLKFKKTHKSKMSVLKHLRDQLLVNISK